MSNLIQFDTPFHSGRLIEELAAIPALAPVQDAALGGPRARFKLAPVETGWVIIVPDNTDEAAIAAVIAAHDPTPPPPKPTRAEIRKSARDEILAMIAQPGGDAQTKAMLRAVLTRLLDMIDATSPA